MVVKDIFNIKKGKKAKESNFGERYIQIEDLRNDFNWKYAEIDPKNVLCDKNDILIAWDGANAGTIGYNLEGVLGSTLAKLTPKKVEIIHPNYCGRFLQSKFNYLRENCTGATIPHISRASLENLEIPLPNLETQKRIAAILDEADTLRQLNQQLIAKYDALTQSLFLDMFGDPVTNPMGWDVYLGKDLFKYSSGRYNPTKNLNDSFRFPTYGGNGITGYSKDWLVDYATIIIGRVGAYCGSVHITNGKIWVTDNAIYIKTFKQSMNLIFCFEAFKKYNLNRFADFSGQPKITQKPLESLEFIYPPIHLQTQFAERVQVIEQQKQQAQDALQKSELLFNSLLQKAFNGTL
ncbi:restriction endonuclease subunit S [Mariniflexile maritimum]|uniref:restriction endonuclease subunit S n=1 Tax=Mariniflexile maritimum TaxID=2682493 RepID=UPI001E4C63A7|nr:restriction endonuclease subunit S [Mariniflexile maritimum]